MPATFGIPSELLFHTLLDYLIILTVLTLLVFTGRLAYDALPLERDSHEFFDWLESLQTRSAPALLSTKNLRKSILWRHIAFGPAGIPRSESWIHVLYCALHLLYGPSTMFPLLSDEQAALAGP